MLSRRFVSLAALCGFGCLGLSLHASLSAEQATQSRIAPRVLAARMLTGTVRSASGEALGGVAVSARAADKTFTTTVYTDERGGYIFPPLDGGRYRVWAQAVGFEAGRAEVALDPKAKRRQDFTLKTIADFTLQLSGSQWMAALPEDTPEHRRLKQVFQGLCTSCHVPQFVLQNRFDEAGWRAVITSMETFGSTGGWSQNPNPIIQYHKEELSTYLAEMRGPGPSPMKFTLPARPQGDAARVVVTEFDVPPAETPDQLAPHDGTDWSEGAPAAYLARGLHDVVPDLDGNAWVNDSVTNKNRTYAKVDVKTGKVTNFTVPGGGDGYVRGSHSLAVGPDGMVWMDLYAGRSVDGRPVAGGESLGMVDPKTLKFELFHPPAGMTEMSDFVAVDGKNKVWAVTRSGVMRFDPETKQFTHDFKGQSQGFYDVAGDAEGNGWWAIIRLDKLGFADLKTGKVTEIALEPRKETDFSTPRDREVYEKAGKGFTTFGNNIGVFWAQAPRRLGADPTRPVMWAANWFGQNIAEVDIRTHKITYHPAPDPYSSPYDTDVDAEGMVYVSLRNAEAVGKFNPDTKQWTLYQLPTQGVEARHISVDRVRGDVWLPYWRTSKAGRLQFRTEEEIRKAAGR